MTKAIARQKLHFVTKCVLQGIATKKRDRHMRKYGLMAYFKLKMRLNANLRLQWGSITHDQRNQRRAQFGIVYKGTSNFEPTQQVAEKIVATFTLPIV